MNQRANPFAGIYDAPVFAVRPRKETPIAEDAIDSIAEAHKFPSREAKKTRAAPKRKPRVYRTGRNQHLGIKATAQTVERFYKAADDRGVPLGRVLELALDALERGGEMPDERAEQGT
jgi:hypothetical protein